jgi:hypothetical protein
MNSTVWKWLLMVNCLIAVPASFAADHNIGMHNPLAHAVHQQHKTLALDPSKFQYMDSVPVYNTHHVRAAVMVFEKKNNTKNQCAALTGEARHHCYELAMPT